MTECKQSVPTSLTRTQWEVMTVITITAMRAAKETLRLSPIITIMTKGYASKWFEWRYHLKTITCAHRQLMLRRRQAPSLQTLSDIQMEAFIDRSTSAHRRHRSSSVPERRPHPLYG